MIKHITFSAQQVPAAGLAKKQKDLRDQAAVYVNEHIGSPHVVNINETFLPEEGYIAITIWYRTFVAEITNQKLMPEELSAELLDRRVKAINLDPIDLLADERMVRGHG